MRCVRHLVLKVKIIESEDFRRVYKIAKLLSLVLMEQICSQWKDFREIRYMKIFRESVQKFQGSLQYDKNNEYCTGSRPNSHLS
jgi:hypothetical protein